MGKYVWHLLYVVVLSTVFMKYYIIGTYHHRNRLEYTNVLWIFALNVNNMKGHFAMFGGPAKKLKEFGYKYIHQSRRV